MENSSEHKSMHQHWIKKVYIGVFTFLNSDKEYWRRNHVVIYLELFPSEEGRFKTASRLILVRN